MKKKERPKPDPLPESRREVAVSSMSQGRLNRMLAQSISSYSQAKFLEAESIATQIYQVDACWLDNLLLLSAIHFQLRNFSEALFYSQQALRVDPDFAEAFSNLGNALKELGDLEGAVQAYQKAIKLKPRYSDPYNNLATTYAQQGRIEDAVETYKMALLLNPSLVDAHSNLGNLYKAQGRFEEAKKSYLEAVRISPQFAIAWSNLGGIFKEEHNFKSAVSYYEEAIRIDPAFADAHSNLGCALREMGKIAEAKKALGRAIAIRPDFAIAHGNLASCFFAEGDLDEAIRKYKYAIQLEPNYPDAYNNLGNALRAASMLDEAIDSYRTALKLKLDHPHAYNNLGNALKEKGMVKEAVHCYTTACRLKPRFPEAQNNLGSLLKEQGKLRQAIAHFQEAVSIDPRFAEAYSNMGNAYKELGEVEEAIRCYTTAIKLKPDLAHAYCNLASAFRDTGRFQDAVTCYEKTLELAPDYSLAFVNLCFARASVCKWDTREEDVKKLLALVREEVEKENCLPAMQPYFALVFQMSLEVVQELARKYAKHVRHSVSLMAMPTVHHFKPKKAHERLRVGYVASQFGNHPVAQAMASVFSLHDRLRFEVFCYSLGADDDSSGRRELEERVEHFKDLSEMTYFESARLIRSDHIHILVNLDGYMHGGGNQVFAMRPAPVQVSYMGYHATLGADYIDYLLADKVACPLELAEFYDEKIVHLPNTFVVADHKQSARSVLNQEGCATRADFGLPEAKVVYCCFSQHHKIDPPTFRTWMAILKRVPNSMLWLLHFPADTRENLVREAEALGVKASKLHFTELIPKKKHLERAALADVFLDTPAVNAFTTAADMLWAGTPIVTMTGQSMASRVCASMLHAAGLDDLVCTDLPDYEDKAVELGSNLEALWALRKKLETSRDSSPLFDTRRTVRALEKAMSAMWNKQEWGSPVDHITVTE
jgi:protein O-GlcNAc transferase